MEESSRGNRESNPPSLRLWRTSPSSRDLMARFDMAHDRADRSPEVRAYLENLRPQILKLQRELRLQTEEDIAGLDRRDDLEMNDVDVLVGLIKAFSTAWKENRLTRGQEEEVAAVEAFKTAGKAWEAFGEIVSETIGGEVGMYDEVALIRATALAGEPNLAWMWYQRCRTEGTGREMMNDMAWVSPTQEIPTLLAIGEGYRRRGERPSKAPARDWEGTVLRLLEDDELWRGNTTDGERKLHDQVAFDAAMALGNAHLISAAVHAAGQIKDTIRWLDAMDAIGSRFGMNVLVIRALDAFAGTSFDMQPPVTQIQYFFITGNPDKAMDMYHEEPGGWIEFSDLIAAGLVHAGRKDEALKIIAETRDNYLRTDYSGRVAHAFLSVDDLPNALRFIPDNPSDDMKTFEPHEIADLVAGLLRLNADPELILRLARAPLEFLALDLEAHLYSLRRTVPMLFEAGIDPTPIVSKMRTIAQHWTGDANREESPNQLMATLLELDAGIALRTFKRAAKMYREPGTSRSAEWDRDAWDRKSAEITEGWEHLTSELTYDEPIE